MNNGLNPTVVTPALALECFENDELAALHNSITGFGRVFSENLAFAKAVKAALIKEDGYAYDIGALKEALTFVVSKRVDEGRYV